MRERARDARQSAALAHADLVVEPIDLAVARTNFARAQRLDRLLGALVENAFLERFQVRRNKILAREDKATAAVQFKRRRVAVHTEIEPAHQQNLSI